MSLPSSDQRLPGASSRGEVPSAGRCGRAGAVVVWTAVLSGLITSASIIGCPGATRMTSSVASGPAGDEVEGARIISLSPGPAYPDADIQVLCSVFAEEGGGWNVLPDAGPLSQSYYQGQVVFLRTQGCTSIGQLVVTVAHHLYFSSLNYEAADGGELLWSRTILGSTIQAPEEQRIQGSEVQSL